MKQAQYKGKIWSTKDRYYSSDLLKLLISENNLVVMNHGKHPYKVILGVPHQAAIGQKHICEEGEPRVADENAVSYAIVAFTKLKEHDIPCKIVVAALSTRLDPNKDINSQYCQEIFAEPCELLIECHGAGAKRVVDLEISAGQNNLSNALRFGELLSSALQQTYTIAAQSAPGGRDALIYSKDGTEEGGKLENPANHTKSLIEAKKRGIPALHIEAKPVFRKTANEADSVTPEGLLLGRALAYSIIANTKGREDNPKTTISRVNSVQVKGG